MNYEELLDDLRSLCTNCPEYIKPLDITCGRQNEELEALQTAFSEVLTPGQKQQFECWLETFNGNRQTDLLLEFASGLELGAQLARMLG